MISSPMFTARATVERVGSRSPPDCLRMHPSMPCARLRCGAESPALNLPHTPMRDLVIHNQDLIVATHGRSLWVLDDIGPLREVVGPATAVTLLKPSPAVRARRSTGTDTPIPPDEPSGRNPPNGAVIDYYLPQAAKGAVAIEVLDSNGAVLRRVSSTDSIGFSAAEREKELIPQYWIRQPKALGTMAGMNRFVWDLAGG